MKKDDLIELARIIKIQRAKLGITQHDLANISGVSYSSVAFIESINFRRKPRFETLMKLEKALQLKENTLTKFI